MASDRRHPRKEGRDAIEELKSIGWIADETSGSKGYFRLKCSCGQHISWLHLTPSNPNYFRERVSHCRRTCAAEEIKD